MVFNYAETVDGVAGTGSWLNLYWRAADGSVPMKRLTTKETWQEPTSVSPDGRVPAFTWSTGSTGQDKPMGGEKRMKMPIGRRTVSKAACVIPYGRQ